MQLIDIHTAVSHIRQSHEQGYRHCFLVGAGISVPSVPSAAEIVEQLKDKARSMGRGDDGAAPAVESQDVV
jgi:hypothetical protein